ncbi:MAG: GntR family transcriptional regulator [Lentisphaerae bacterium]|nr:GntR family transcriptional regulator [Lentisphaerota bacterium]
MHHTSSGGAEAGGGLVRAPVYLQLNQLLREMIGREGFKPGQQFLSEREVGERFGVSRVTANKALSQLVIAGDLEFRKGIGTFVREGGLDYDLQSLVSFTRKAEAAGKRPETRVLDFATMRAADAGPEVREALGLSGGDAVVHFERLRLADGVPFILERRHVVAGLCPGLTRKKLEGSLYALFVRTYGLAVTSARQTIRAVNLSARDASHLGVAPGSAALRVHAVGATGRGPLWVEDTYYRGDLYEFRNELGVSGRARPASLAIAGPTDDGRRKTEGKKRRTA